MKNRIKDFDDNFPPEDNSDDEPIEYDDPGDIFKMLQEMMSDLLNHKLFDSSNDEEIKNKYIEECQKVVDGLPQQTCKFCGNPYYKVIKDGFTTTVHPTGFACHWCNYNLYNQYYSFIRFSRANSRGTYSEKILPN